MALATKWPQDEPRRFVLSIVEPRPPMGSRRPPEGSFSQFSGRGRQMATECSQKANFEHRRARDHCYFQASGAVSIWGQGARPLLLTSIWGPGRGNIVFYEDLGRKARDHCSLRTSGDLGRATLAIYEHLAPCVWAYVGVLRLGLFFLHVAVFLVLSCCFVFVPLHPVF